MNPVEQAFAVMPSDVTHYTSYWRSITPTNDDDRFRRWLFAFCSVHTSWEGNVRGYQALKDLGWVGRPVSKLLSRLKWSGVGIHNQRAGYISRFSWDFWRQPRAFRRSEAETWVEYRDRLVDRITGLGLAKVSFAIEMMHPLAAEITCLDVHMCRLYGIPQANKTKRMIITYKQTEKDWVDRSLAKGVSPYITRSLYWDRLQNQTNTRYWSHCLERN